MKKYQKLCRYRYGIPMTLLSGKPLGTGSAKKIKKLRKSQLSTAFKVIITDNYMHIYECTYANDLKTVKSIHIVFLIRAT